MSKSKAGLFHKAERRCKIVCRTALKSVGEHCVEVEVCINFRQEGWAGWALGKVFKNVQVVDGTICHCYECPQTDSPIMIHIMKQRWWTRFFSPEAIKPKVLKRIPRPCEAEASEAYFFRFGSE